MPPLVVAVLAVGLAVAILALRDSGALPLAPATDASVGLGNAPDADAAPSSIAADRALAASEAPGLDATEIAWPAIPPGFGRLRVVDAATGDGVAGATVWYDSIADWPPFEHRGPDSPFTQDNDRFRDMQLSGHRTVTDADGWTLVQVCRAPITVAAAAGGATGCVTFDRSTSTAIDGWTLPIAPSRSFAIEVRDASGRPVANAPLIYAIGDADDSHHIGRTDAAGRRLVEHADPLFTGPVARVRVAWPGGEQSARPIPRSGSSDVRITLPAGGAVELRLLGPDELPLPGCHAVKFVPDREAGPDARGPRLRTDPDGVLRLPHVPLFATLYAVVEGRLLEILGPRRAGENVVVDVSLRREGVLLRGRLLDAAGVPVAATPIAGSVVPADADRFAGLLLYHLLPKRRWTASMHASNPPPEERQIARCTTFTDGEGRFAFTVAARKVAAELRGDLQVERGPRDPDCRHVEFTVAVPPDRAVVDVGDLVLGDAGLVMRGRVVDEHGNAVREARLGSGPLASRVALAADGTFKVWRNQPSPAKPVKVYAAATGFVTAEHTGSEGENGVVLRLRRAATVRLECLVDPAALELTDQIDAEIDGVTMGLWPVGDRWVGELVRPPGDCGVSARIAAEEDGGEIFAERVHFVAGRYRTERIDLRGRLFVHEVEVRDERGRALDARCCRRDPESGELLTGYPIAHAKDGVARILSLRPSQDLWVVARDHEARQVRVGTARTLVVLGELPLLSLYLFRPEEFAALTFTLRRRLPDGSSDALPTDRFRVASLEPIEVEVAVSDDAGEFAVLPLGVIRVRPGTSQSEEFELEASALDQLRILAAGR
ncbi:MAG: hypothetical protein KDE27_08915 [Planctomycetes bacterium]|nr:hypothetical protein [Planctomycetota bacterium]